MNSQDQQFLTSHFNAALLLFQCFRACLILIAYYPSCMQTNRHSQGQKHDTVVCLDMPAAAFAAHDMRLRVPQVAVCTPGRMIDLIKMKACNMLRATYLVFDEADRMFDMGFEPQVSTQSPHMLGCLLVSYTVAYVTCTSLL